MSNLYKNIFQTAILMVIFTEFSLAGLCQTIFTCKPIHFFIVPLFTVALTILSFYTHQYSKTLQLILKKRPHPLPLKQNFPLNFNHIFNKTQNRFWRVNFSNGSRILVHRDEMFMFLLKVSELQLSVSEQKSPISQRSHPNLTRRRWQAYRRLLFDSKAVVEKSKNVIVLKEQYVVDPWSLIQYMEENLPMEEE